VLCLGFAPLVAAADFRDIFIDPEDGMLDASKYLSEHPMGFLPVPVIITEPAVGYGLGMFGIFFHESPEQRKQRLTGGGSLLPKDVSFAGFAATENGTWGGGAGHVGFWKEDHLRYLGAVLYPSVNMDFYRLGGVDLPAPIGLSFEGPIIFNRLQHRIGDSDLFVGVSQVYLSMDLGLEHADEGGLLPPELADWVDSNFADSVTTSGLGLLAEYDSRDNPFNPVTGYDYTLKYTRFDDAIGSDVDYSAYTLTGLNFWKWREQFHLGFRVQYDGVSAGSGEHLPPYVLPSVQLRGIPTARYQGDAVLVSEVQFDWQLSFRWRIGAFLGAGRAASSFGDLADETTVVNKGIGFRYLVARRYGFVMGIDIARGPEDTAFYIQAGSTWR
jgi:hypothetical protein